MIRNTFWLTAAFALVGCAAEPASHAAAPAAVETEPVRGGGDSGDDMCIWLHPTDLSQSTVIGTDSKNGVAVYDLAERELAFHADGATGMVDLRYNFPLGDRRVAIVAAGNHAENRIALYRVDPESRDLVEVSARSIQPDLQIYGTCMYYSPDTDAYYAVVTSPEGEVEQWRLIGTEDGNVDAERVRRFTLNPDGPDPGYTIEGCVADDQLGRLYLAQEDAGRIWRVGAESTDPADSPLLIDKPKREGGHTVADVEGLAIYRDGNSEGYLLASNQGNYAYTVYRRQGANPYVTTFKIAGSESVDPVTSDDSIEVTNLPLNDRFPEGLLVTEDGNNTEPGNAGNNNYKLVPWEKIAAVASPELSVNTAWDPRRVGTHEKD